MNRWGQRRLLTSEAGSRSEPARSLTEDSFSDRSLIGPIRALTEHLLLVVGYEVTALVPCPRTNAFKRNVRYSPTQAMAERVKQARGQGTARAPEQAFLAGLFSRYL